ncbi:hypothetical protein [Legionella santicrucis]|uniref:hypothetical protein n=1 Tax=Legionella santicrucis TaxID=45074 RepID=UPI001055E7A3|nr:hypothetical protein [Legionella santicrucis]
MTFILGFTLNFSAYADQFIYHNIHNKSIKPSHTKRTKIAALQNISPSLKEGIYEFAFTQKQSTEIFSWFRLLIIAEDRYPGFLGTYGVVNTPVTVTWTSPNSNNFTFVPMNVSSISSDVDGDVEIIMKTTDDSDDSYMIKLKDDTHGELYTSHHGEDIEKNGDVYLNKFIDLSNVRMDYFEYNANLSKLNENLNLSQHCPDKNYKGKIGFLKIPKTLSKFANGWMMGAYLQNDDCSVSLAQPAIGLLNSDLLGLNGEFIFKGKDEVGVVWTGYDYSILSIKGIPGDSNLEATLNFDALYDNSSPTLTFELTKEKISPAH